MEQSRLQELLDFKAFLANGDRKLSRTKLEELNELLITAVEQQNTLDNGTE